MYKYLHFGVRLHLRERNSGSVPPLGYNHVIGNTRGGYRSPKNTRCLHHFLFLEKVPFVLKEIEANRVGWRIHEWENRCRPRALRFPARI